VVQRSGLARATVEAVLPHVFDEIRYQLTEGSLCVPIDGFGTFAVIDRPEHEFYYKKKDEIHTVPARKQLKFRPAKNLKREVEAGQYDPTRRAFSRHPDDPIIAVRRDMRYRPVKNYKREEGSWGKPLKKDDV
jgi:nucleoid DNA-binding protein